MIIVARLVQGAFGALLIPQGFGILGSVFPREHIGKAFSAFGPTLGLSAVGGPLLAGLLIDANLFGLGWRPMFLINIVLGAAGLAAGLTLLPHDVGDRTVSIDALGSALLAACMLGLLFGLIQGSTDGWTAVPIAALAAGVILFAAFAQRQRIAAVPLIKPSLLRNRGFTAGLILGLVFFATVAGLLYAVSLFLQRGVGYSPERAAVTGFAPAAVGIVIASVACRNLLTRLGRRLSLAGIVVTVGGVAVLAAIVAHSGTAASAAELALAMTLIGLGMGATFSTIYNIAIGDIDPARRQRQRLAQLHPATGQRDRRGRHHHDLPRRASRRPGARHDPQPAHGHRHRRAELPGHPVAAAPPPARRPALTKLAKAIGISRETIERALSG